MTVSEDSGRARKTREVVDRALGPTRDVVERALCPKDWVTENSNDDDDNDPLPPATAGPPMTFYFELLNV